MGNFLLGLAIGAVCMVIAYHKMGFGVVIHKHYIGRTIQFMERRKQKILDGDELTADISKN